jgi:cell division transport system ATP-binding protein
MSEKPPSIIELLNITTGYGNRTVLDGVTLLVQPGDLVVIEGATGAGKTTLMRVLLGEQPLKSGSARVLETHLGHAANSALIELRKKIGIVFQIPRFIEQENALFNVALPLAIRGESVAHCRAQGTRALMDTSLMGSAHKKPPQLSGGEQARLQIARALIHKPQLLLADEPFAHLDPDSAVEAEQLLANAHAQGTTLIITTHRPTKLMEKARRFRLEHGKLSA